MRRFTPNEILLPSKGSNEWRNIPLKKRCVQRVECTRHVQFSYYTVCKIVFKCLKFQVFSQNQVSKRCNDGRHLGTDPFRVVHNSNEKTGRDQSQRSWKISQQSKTWQSNSNNQVFWYIGEMNRNFVQSYSNCQVFCNVSKMNKTSGA